MILSRMEPTVNVANIFQTFCVIPDYIFLKIVAKMFKFFHLLTVGISATPLDIYVAKSKVKVRQEVSTFIFF
jgi:hypothetical protein